ADDHALVRRGLRAAIDEDAHLTVVAEVADGAEALRALQTFQPQVAVMDYGMPQLNALEVVAKAQELGVECAYILITMHKEEALFNEAISQGVLGYVLKENAVEELIAGIRQVAVGRHFFSPEVSDFMVHRHQRSVRLSQARTELRSLTPAETQILRLVAQSRTSREIGRLLGVSPRTVDNHRTNIAAKLSLAGVHSLVKFAIEHRDSL
ncbi:MAG: response regulator transcription factor, partial [Verrucomicrobiota bacterium]